MQTEEKLGEGKVVVPVYEGKGEYMIVEGTWMKECLGQDGQNLD